MSETIPPDVMEAACTVAIEVECMPSSGNILAIAAALLARDERAAKIAETEGVYPELNVWAGGPEWYRHGKRIASAIRDRSKT